IDISEPSLEVARELAEQYQLSNIEHRQGDLLELDEVAQYDVIQSIGVIHHLSDPQRGLNRLQRALKDSGVMIIWLYHPFGERERLQQRKLLHVLWGEKRDDLALGEQLMKALDLQLDTGHYGPRTLGSDELAGNADAYMHPIVEAYELGPALDMVRESGCTWAAVDFLTIRWGMKFVNLAEVSDPVAPTSLVEASLRAAYNLRVSDILTDESLHDRFRALSKREQLAIIELVVNPRGFQIVAGMGTSYERFNPRICGNVIEF
ncbi:MAG: methyltransferase domain-containing protein, partial [Myxococcota bacterium]